MTALIAAGVLPGLWSGDAFAQTLARVRQRGAVVCGVSQGLPGFSNPDSHGAWTGIDVDLCRGVAAAIFADPAKVKFVGLAAKDRFTALQVGEIDLLSHDTTWTLARDAALGLNFTGVTYYDGQGLMVRRSAQVTSVRDLDGASICTQTGTTTELNVSDFFKANRLKYELVAFESADETLKSYETGRCDVFTNDISSLYAQRLKMDRAGDHVILPDVISKEPLGPAVRQGDDQWFDIVRWTLFAMIDAEELGLTSTTIEGARMSASPDVRRFIGADGDPGVAMGLSPDWAANVIRMVGNYGEVFDRNVGQGSALAIPRGPNRLWSQGGIQYAPPIR